MGKKLLLILIGIIILFINYYPHYYAFIKTPPNYVYTGQASWFDPWDITNYWATIKSAQKERKILLTNINTTATVRPAFVYPLYTIIGTIFLEANNILLYHALTLIGGALLIWGLFVLSNLLLKNTANTLWTLVLISLGGGLGFLFSTPGVSADLNIPGVTFLSNFQKPHEAVAALLYISSLIFFFLSIKEKKRTFLLKAILAGLLLIPFYPYRLLSLYLITGIWAATAGALTSWGILLAVTLPWGILYVWHFLTSGFSVLTSYEPLPVSLISLVFGYGAFIILFIYQLFWSKEKSLLRTFLNIWVGVSLGLALLPWGMGRLFLSGLMFPLAITFILFFKTNKVLVMGLALLVLLPSSLYVFGRRIDEVKNNNVWYYLPQTIKQGFDFLEKSE